MPPKSRPELARLAVFGVTGTLNTAICFGVYAALVDACDWHYNAARAADYVVGAVLGFVLHRVATFGDRREVRSAFSKYVVTLIAALLLNVALLHAAVEQLVLGPLFGQAASLAGVTLFSYALQTHWVFRCHAESVTADDAAVTVSRRAA